ncbi:MAG: hypothetical protein ACP5O1_12880, partial [Phycisphaerae bacterium]
GEQVSLFGGVAICRHGTAGNSTERQLGGVTRRASRCEAPLGDLAFTPPSTMGIGDAGAIHR